MSITVHIIRLRSSVGVGGTNHREDVRVIQRLLNLNPDVVRPPLKVDGWIGPNTNRAIADYQRYRGISMVPTGVINAGDETMRRLAADAARVPPVVPEAPPARPAAPSDFMASVNEFVADVAQVYGVTVTVNANFRPAKKAQRMHLAHMIRFNHYRTATPAHHETNAAGRSVVAFSHLTDTSVTWGGEQEPSDFLRDAADQAVRLVDGAWSSPPDETKTRARALSILQSYGVGTPSKDPGKGVSNGAQVACGYRPCPAPCGCGVGRSRHVGGAAADLGNMSLLQAALTPPTLARVDELLAGYGLHRPVATEPWHVESID